MPSDQVSTTEPPLGDGSTRIEAADADQSARVLAAFATARRQAWRRYLAALLALAVVVAVGVWLVWRHSEIRAVSSRTTSIPATALPQAALAKSLAPTWSSSDHLPAGDPISADVLVTYSQHAVMGRDIRSGAVRWSYTRSNRSVCAVDVQDSVAVAVYSDRGLCDEVTGLKTDSGQRAFVRTLTLDAVPATLHLLSIPGYLAIVAPDGIELISPGDRNVPGVDFWLDDQNNGCATTSAVLGSAGVLIASHCASGDTLSLRTLGNKSGRDWTIPAAGRAPLAAAQEVVALAADGQSVEFLSPNKGALLGKADLVQHVSAPASPKSIDLAGTTDYLVPVTGGFLALRSTHLLHQGDSASPPAVIQSGLLLAGSGQLRTAAYSTGQITQVRTVPGLTPAAVVQTSQAYLVAATADGVSVYH
jgi:hypothetical protein